ncbi:MAG: phage major capsid protein [Sulfuricaulis sp.]|nr:phage major capsid protein [Sulfuricaulis sp.]
MAFANSSYSDIITTTIESRSRDLADNWENNNALLRKMRAKGNSKPFSGGNLILQEIGYTDPSSINANSYSGYEVINIAPNSPISAAQYGIKQYAGAVSMSGLEMLQNSGKEAFIDLMEGRMQISEGQLFNRMDYDMYQDGTGNASKNITGLALAVPDDPTTGTYGGIPRGTYNFWRSQYYRGVTDGGAAVSSANIQAYMTTLALRCVRGNNKPDLWIGDATYFGFYVNSLQAIQRIQSMSGDGKAGAGFGPELSFYGGGMAATVVMGGGVSGAVSSSQLTSGATAAHMWGLNTDFLFWRPHRDRNFVPIGGERQSVNQDAVVKLFGVAGNMTSNGPQFSGVLIA